MLETHSKGLNIRVHRKFQVGDLTWGHVQVCQPYDFTLMSDDMDLIYENSHYNITFKVPQIGMRFLDFLNYRYHNYPL